MIGVMIMMKINEKINNIIVNVKLEEGINCIDFNESGTGKSYLMSIIRSFCVKNGIKYKSFNYNNDSLEVISDLKNIQSDIKVILLDNADLILTPELSALLSELQNIIIIVGMKRRSRLPAGYKLCRVEYHGNYLHCEEIKYEHSNVI